MINREIHPVNLENKENIVISGLNYSPNRHLDACTEEQKRNNVTCNEAERCLNEYENGCISSWAFSDGEHYLRNIKSKNVVKYRCLFLVTRHPADRKQYFSGVIFITDTNDDENLKTWITGEPIPFDEQIVEWNGHYRVEKWISNRGALDILEKYYSQVQEQKVKQMIDFYRTGKLPGFLSDSDSESAENFFGESLKIKKQIILYGPPGTGKTYRASEIAVKFIELEEV
ncbi:hypothetical protein [Candidatus Pyrohabitans sp.]